jgi:hypothetical protein
MIVVNSKNFGIRLTALKDIADRLFSDVSQIQYQLERNYMLIFLTNLAKMTGNIKYINKINYIIKKIIEETLLVEYPNSRENIFKYVSNTLGEMANELDMEYQKEQIIDPIPKTIPKDQRDSFYDGL